MKSPMFTRAGFHGTAIVAGLLVVTTLAGCATVSTVTSSVPSVPPSTFGHANSVRIDESSAAVNIATHERLLAVANPIGFSLRAFALGTSIAGLRHDNIQFARNGERLYPSGYPEPTGFLDSVLVADQRGIFSSPEFDVALRFLVTN
jgi:uncharacterized protein YceK